MHRADLVIHSKKEVSHWWHPFIFLFVIVAYFCFWNRIIVVVENFLKVLANSGGCDIIKEII